MPFFKNAGDYGDPLKNARFFPWIRTRPYNVETVQKKTATYLSYENKVHASGGVSEPQAYSSAEREIEYLMFRTLMAKHFPPSGISERHITRYDPDVDRVVIENALEDLFGEKVLGHWEKRVDSTGDWVDSAGEEGFTVYDIPGLVSGLRIQSEMSKTDQTDDFASDSVPDDPSVDVDMESLALEQMLDEILDLDDAIDDVALEDIEDILDEPVENDMPEADDTPEMDTDMEPMDDPMEMNPYML